MGITLFIDSPETGFQISKRQLRKKQQQLKQTEFQGDKRIFQIIIKNLHATSFLFKFLEHYHLSINCTFLNMAHLQECNCIALKHVNECASP